MFSLHIFDTNLDAFYNFYFIAQWWELWCNPRTKNSWWRPLWIDGCQGKDIGVHSSGETERNFTRFGRLYFCFNLHLFWKNFEFSIMRISTFFKWSFINYLDFSAMKSFFAIFVFMLPMLDASSIVCNLLDKWKYKVVARWKRGRYFISRAFIMWYIGSRVTRKLWNNRMQSNCHNIELPLTGKLWNIRMRSNCHNIVDGFSFLFSTTYLSICYLPVHFMLLLMLLMIPCNELLEMLLVKVNDVIGYD